MKKLLLLCLLAGSFIQAQPTAYTDGTVLVLPVGVNNLLVTDSGVLNGGTQTIAFSAAANQVVKVSLSIMGLPARGSETPFSNAAGISLDLEGGISNGFGRYVYFYEICDSSGNPLTPRRLSSRLTLKAINPAPTSPPFIVPFSVYGGEGKTLGFTFPVSAGQSTAGLRVWIWAFHMARGKMGIWTNNNPTKPLTATSVVRVISNGSGTCTLETPRPHSLTTGDTIQANFFMYPYGIANMNGLKTVTVTDVTHITVPCLKADGVTAYPAGDYNATNGEVGSLGVPSPAWGDYGKTISKTVFYSDEQRYFGGMDNDGNSFNLMVPLGNTEIVANQNNTLFFQYNGAPAGGHIGQWILDWNVVEPDIEIDQIVVTGGDPLHATAHVKTGTHSYSIGDTVMIQSAPGPRWRFNDERVITGVPDNTHFTFLWGPDTDGFTKYAGLTRTPSTTPGNEWSTAPATYTVPTMRNQDLDQQPHMYAARCIIPKSSMQAWNPANDRVPTGNATNGGTLFNGTATKTRSPYYPNNQAIAKCVDCHTDAGYDFKYFQVPTDLAKVGAMERGFSPSQAEDIVTYIKANSTTPPLRCRWWSPPYQPSPGMNWSSVNILNWACGAGNDWALTYDQDMSEWLTPGGSFSSWAASGNIDLRTIPKPYEFPAWTKWLPVFHPLDTYNFAGLDFTTNTAWTHYNLYKNALKAASTTGAYYTAYQTHGGATGTNGAYFSGLVPNGDDAQAVKIQIFPNNNANGLLSAASYQPPAVWGLTGEGVDNWFITRSFELWHQPLSTAGIGLEGLLGQSYSDNDTANGWPSLATRCTSCSPYYFYGWFNANPFDNGPHKAGPGSSAAFRDNPWGQINGRNHNSLTEKWYKMQFILNSGNRRLSGEFPEDCPYTYAYSNAYSEQRPSPWLNWEINAMIPQSTWGAPFSNTDPSNGPSLNITYIGTEQVFGQDRYNNAITQGAEQVFMGEVASQFQEFIARWTTAGTATAFPCPVGQPLPKYVYTNSIVTYCSVVAFALELFDYYRIGCNGTAGGCVAGTPSTAQINAIVSWADTVWPGNNFSQYAAMGNTCSFTASMPPSLKCTNWN
jgi:hypothetical protein